MSSSVGARIAASTGAPLEPTIRTGMERAFSADLSANDGMVIGNFELTWERGEVRCKTAIDLEGGQLTLTMWRNLITANVNAMDRYLAALTHVANGVMSPADAVREAEA